MRNLIISDIHANWEALDAVLADADGDYDRILCCGDIVGYGADPNAATDWVREHVAAVVRGNHDKAAVGSEDIEWFNSAAKAATLWTQASLSETNTDYLEKLTEGPLRVDGFQLVHGSPLDEDDYLLSEHQAAQLFSYVEVAITFFGHTHLQGGFLVHRNGTRRIGRVPPGEHEAELVLDDQYISLINPGSVGQPRDGDARAAYAIFDGEEGVVRYRRVRYDLVKAQEKIVRAGLPEVLAYRLALGS